MNVHPEKRKGDVAMKGGMTIGRLEFLTGVTGLLAVPSVFAAESRARKGEWRKVTLTVGAERPFKALHVSDTHLTVLTDAEKAESPWRKKYYEGRFVRSFSAAESHLAAAVEFARTHGMTVLHAGDLMDCPSDGNIGIVRRMLPAGSLVAAAGNHETCSRYFRGNDDSTAALKSERERTASRLKSCWPNDPRWFVREVNGVRFVAFDDTDYQIAPDIRTDLERTFADGKPVVLLCHVPFYEPTLMKRSLARWKSPSLVGVPDAVSSAPGRSFRFPEEQRPTALTLDTLAWLKGRTNLKAVLCGHLHIPWQGEFAPGIPMLVAEANFTGGGYEIAFE